MNTFNCDLVVIGSGPGGYVAAIRASQLGLNTICVERDSLGGVCLNWGCIPTKALLKSAEYRHFISKSSDFGFEIKDFNVDFTKVIRRSRDVANKMSNGVGFLFKKYKVQQVKGNGFIKSKGVVEVKDNDGKVTDSINCKNILIATGARPRMLKGIDVDLKKIITSTEAMIPNEIPSSIIIMGAGAIGVEFAYFYNAFGTKVTIVEMLDRILPIEDVDVSNELARNFKKSKIDILTSTKVLSARAKGDGVEVKIQKKDGKEEILSADLALNAIGIQANIENLWDDRLGINLEKGFIKVDKFMKANGIGEAVGFIKLVFDAKYGEILGAHMIGPDVTEMIGEIGVAKTLEATGKSIFKTIHAHPTLSEAIMEAAAQAYGETVNI